MKLEGKLWGKTNVMIFIKEKTWLRVLPLIE